MKANLNNLNEVQNVVASYFINKLKLTLDETLFMSIRNLVSDKGSIFVKHSRLGELVKLPQDIQIAVESLVTLNSLVFITKRVYISDLFVDAQAL